MTRLIFKITSLAAVLVHAMVGEEFPRGRVLERVVCTGNEAQSYALHLPPAYSPERSWPILYCLDPAARGRVPVERFAQAAGVAGWILAGSNNSRNGPLAISREAIAWIVRDTHERFSIDESRIYAAGFSGGARLALSWAANGHIAGVIACGAAFGNSAVPKAVTYAVFGAAGVDDFNFDEVYAMCRELGRRGIRQRFVEFSGGHEWLPEALTGPALDFLSGRLPAEPPPPPSRDQKKAATEYRSLTESIQDAGEDARAAMVGTLRRDADLPGDGVKRRVARRVLLGMYIGAVERGRDWLARGSYPEAVQAWNLAILMRPSSADAYYGLAQAQAGARNIAKSLDALERAVANGFRDRERIEHESLFKALRNEPGFVAAISRIRE